MTQFLNLILLHCTNRPACGWRGSPLFARRERGGYRCPLCDWPVVVEEREMVKRVGGKCKEKSV